MAVVCEHVVMALKYDLLINNEDEGHNHERNLSCGRLFLAVTVAFCLLAAAFQESLSRVRRGQL